MLGLKAWVYRLRPFRKEDKGVTEQGNLTVIYTLDASHKGIGLPPTHALYPLEKIPQLM